MSTYTLFYKINVYLFGMFIGGVYVCVMSIHPDHRKKYYCWNDCPHEELPEVLIDTFTGKEYKREEILVSEDGGYFVFDFGALALDWHFKEKYFGNNK